MSKRIITKWNGAVLTMVQENGKTIQMSLEPTKERSLLGNIYVGKVKNIVKNIGAAFVDIGGGITGYLSLEGSPPHYAFPQRRPGALRAGDEIIVQMERDAVKTKAPVLTGNLNFPGRYLVLTAGKNTIGFSGKISNDGWKKELRSMLLDEKDENIGIIVRTNAPEASFETIMRELKQLKAEYLTVMEASFHRTGCSLLYRMPPSYLSDLRDSQWGTLEAVITDDETIYQTVLSYLESNQPEDADTLKLYVDELLPLYKLYGVEKSMEEALSKRVWLKSGGYLVIEPTEALCVIDVNTGKYSGKKSPEETIRKINLEAAIEIARQIRLRNLSGIIVIDFIDMEMEAVQKELMNLLSRELSKDPIKSTVVDITKLNLVEVTRKKVRRPLYEQLNLHE